eukprot:TRINITY_DN4187_c0_g1_i3.p1 TRINITY_DN4187_c0_g1~~TRINITY_DN4187_c0_g1_i3.p1  ORF type:complete len:382 (+),score=64.62 TRINITY_DN4187_c0_g1_i3:173-1318(+)
MAYRVQLSLCLLSSFLVLAIAASPEELALRNAILSAVPSTVTLTKDVTLTADLPELPDNKVLTVRGRCGSSGKAQCAIRGAKKFRHFWKSQRSAVKVTLDNLVITATKAGSAAVEFGGLNAALTVTNSKFVNNPAGVNLSSVTASISGSQFAGHTLGAIRITSYDLVTPVQVGTLKVLNSVFTNNKGPERGGAVFVGLSVAATFEKSTFTSNTAVFFGGALYFEAPDNVELAIPTSGRVTGCTFSKNKANVGGAVTWRNAVVRFYTTTFKGNEATLAQGGAVALSADSSQRSLGTFKSCSFESNKATKALGGAFRLGMNGFLESCKTTFTGNTGIGGVRSNGYADADGESAGIGTFPFVPIPFVSTDEETILNPLFQASCT